MVSGCYCTCKVSMFLLHLESNDHFTVIITETQESAQQLPSILPISRSLREGCAY